MLKIDCSTVPRELTDFAFDQLDRTELYDCADRDMLAEEGLSVEELVDSINVGDDVTVDYATQVVNIDTELTSLAAYCVRPAVESLCFEKAEHMIMDMNDGYSFEASRDEIEQAKDFLVRDHFDITNK